MSFKVSGGLQHGNYIAQRVLEMGLQVISAVVKLKDGRAASRLTLIRVYVRTHRAGPALKDQMKETICAMRQIQSHSQKGIRTLNPSKSNFPKAPCVLGPKVQIGPPLCYLVPQG